MAKLRAFRIVVHELAEADLDGIITGIAIEAPMNAGRFALRFADRIRSLEKFPARCPFARENGLVSIELRQLLVGRYRAIFSIQSATVHVIRVIHASRDTLAPEQLPDPF